MKIITYKNQTLKTKFYRDITEEKRKEIKNEYYKKPHIEEVSNNIKKLNEGGVMKTKINEYYFKDLYSLVKLNHSKWSIDDVLNSRELMGFVFGKIDSNEKVYPKDKQEIKNVETVFRIGSKGIAQKPSLFPVKTINMLLQRYDVKNYHDYACGWGDRLTGAMINNVNYFGTDVNHKLVERLKEYEKHWRSVTIKDNTCDIRCQKSQVLIEEWVGKMDLSFSSPPYFDLEDYKLGEQSWKEGMTVKDWRDNYLEPTIINSIKYLKDEGIFAININNTKEHNLKKIAYNICINNGLKFLETLKLNNIKRIKSNAELFDNDEDIMVFKKEIVND